MKMPIHPMSNGKPFSSTWKFLIFLYFIVPANFHQLPAFARQQLGSDEVVLTALNISHLIQEYGKPHGNVSIIKPVLDLMAAYCLRGYKASVIAGDSVCITSNHDTGRNGSDVFENVFKNDSVASPNPRIPFILHQTWKDKNIASHAEDALALRGNIRRFAHDFLYVLWTDKDIEELIATDFPQYYATFRSLSRDIMRTDLARYLILYKYGGLYMDLDIELREHIRELIIPSPQMEKLKLVTYRPKLFNSIPVSTLARYNFSYAGNAFLASVPQSDILLRMITYIQNYKTVSMHHQLSLLANEFTPAIARMPGQWKENIREKNSLQQSLGVQHHTGPLGLGAVIDSYLQEITISGGSKVAAANAMIKFLDGKMVGNARDSPKFAVHKRRHHWGN